MDPKSAEYWGNICQIVGTLILAWGVVHGLCNWFSVKLEPLVCRLLEKKTPLMQVKSLYQRAVHQFTGLLKKLGRSTQGELSAYGYLRGSHRSMMLVEGHADLDIAVYLLKKT